MRIVFLSVNKCGAYLEENNLTATPTLDEANNSSHISYNTAIPINKSMGFDAIEINLVKC